MDVIYETKGRAREYNELSINLYTGCGHRCVYCYGPDVIKVNREQWENNPRPRENILERVERDAKILQKRGETRSILLCFVTDPFQPIEDKYHITTQTIQILHKYNQRVTILTKAGKRAMQGIHLLTPGQDTFAVTLTLLDAKESQKWEPFAGLPDDRILNLQIAKGAGLETWVSCEPVINPQITLKIIEKTVSFADTFKVGTMNYHPIAEQIDWRDFARRAKRLLESLHVNYYMKRDLSRHIGFPNGIRVTVKK